MESHQKWVHLNEVKAEERRQAEDERREEQSKREPQVAQGSMMALDAKVINLGKVGDQS